MKEKVSIEFDRVELNQDIFLNKEGFIVESDNQIFDVEAYRTKMVTIWCPVLETMLDYLWKDEKGTPTILNLQMLENPAPMLSGHFDFFLERVLYNDQEFVYWRITDFTAMYKEKREKQQSFYNRILKKL